MNELIATSIEFKKHSIVYEFEIKKEFKNKKGFVVCHNSIENKDLILKTTLIDSKNNRVCFVPVNVTVEFYQKMFLDSKSKLSQEHRLEKNDVYDIGEVIGHAVWL